MWNLMYLIFYIVLDKIFDCKIQIYVCLGRRLLSVVAVLRIWIFESKYLPMKIAIPIFSLFSSLKSIRKDNIMISLLVGRRILDNNKRDF